MGIHHFSFRHIHSKAIKFVRKKYTQTKNRNEISVWWHSKRMNLSNVHHSPATVSKARGLLCGAMYDSCIYQTAPSPPGLNYTQKYLPFFLSLSFSLSRRLPPLLTYLSDSCVECLPGKETIRINFHVWLIAHQKRNIGNILYMFFTHLLFSNNFSVSLFSAVFPLVLIRFRSHGCHFHNVCNFCRFVFLRFFCVNVFVFFRFVFHAFSLALCCFQREPEWA